MKSIHHDPLHDLMIYCPHVEILDFGKHFTFKLSTDFEYFLLALKGIKNWGLHVIPDPDFFKNYDISQYKQLANLLEDNLSHIVIEKRKIDDYDNDYLTRHPKLSSVRIDYHETACILDCVYFIRNVTRLNGIQVKFNKYSTVENDSILDIKPFANIRKLHITNFLPHQKDLITIKERFTAVIDLSIKIHNCGWMEDERQLSPLLDFVKHVSERLPKYCITFKVSRKTYSFKLRDKMEFKHLFEELRYEKFKLRSNCRFRDITEMKLSTDEICLNLDYSSSEFMSRLVDVKTSLSIIGQFSRNIIFVLDDRDNKVHKYLNLVFTLCPQSEKLKICGGALSSLFQQELNNASSLSHLALSGMSLSEDSLSRLSSSFVYLQVLRLEHCEFPEIRTIGRSRDTNNGYRSENSRDSRYSSSDSSDSHDSGNDVVYAASTCDHKIKITMNSTEFKLLEVISLYRIDLNKFTLIVKVTLKSALQQYYIINDSGKSALKVSQNEYNAVVEYSRKGIMAICLIASSIETFKFSVPGLIQFALKLAL